MELIANIFLGVSSLIAAMYCWILSRRLKAFSKLDRGVGGAVSLLSSQVEELDNTLKKAQHQVSTANQAAENSIERAESAALKLETLIASLHDLDVHDAFSVKATRESAPAIFQRRKTSGSTQ